MDELWRDVEVRWLRSLGLKLRDDGLFYAPIEASPRLAARDYVWREARVVYDDVRYAAGRATIPVAYGPHRTGWLGGFAYGLWMPRWLSGAHRALSVGRHATGCGHLVDAILARVTVERARAAPAVLDVGGESALVAWIGDVGAL